MSGVVTGDDGIVRCPWGVSTPEYRAYHDDEWGRPVGDETRVYEMLCLEGFQSGLSWLTVLRKREHFREAFASFDPNVVAGFDDGDVSRLLADAGIIRHRGKILATIANAQATVSMRTEGISLAGLFWKHAPVARPVPIDTADLLAVTEESKALSNELLGYGFRFVGPTTVYSAMQSLGIVNDHLRDCHFRDAVEQERAKFTTP